jgi:adenosylhomocysteine nucleosidase
MLGVVVALPWELKTLTRQTLQAGTCSPITDNMTVALSGIGPQRAAAAAALLLSRGVTALLSWGSAAALDDGCRPGSVVLPEWVVGRTGERHRVTSEWHREVCNRLSAQYSVRTDALVESHELVKNRAEKRRLALSTRAFVTDMESAAQARFAREHRLPFLVVRAVLDSASIQLPENVIETLDPNGKIRVRSFLAHVAIRPAEWPTFVKLGMQFRAARTTLQQTSTAVLEASQAYLTAISPGTIASRG